MELNTIPAQHPPEISVLMPEGEALLSLGGDSTFDDAIMEAVANHRFTLLVVPSDLPADSVLENVLVQADRLARRCGTFVAVVNQPVWLSQSAIAFRLTNTVFTSPKRITELRPLESDAAPEKQPHWREMRRALSSR